MGAHSVRFRPPDWSLGWIGIFGSLAALEVVTRTELLPSRHFPPPSETLSTLAGEIHRVSLWSDVASTLEGWAIGLALAFAIAVPLGIAVGSSALLYRALRFPIEFLRPIPSVALIPVLVLVYGSGLESKVFLVFFASVWPLLIQTIYGVQDADPVATDTARAFRFGHGQRLLRVTLPGAVPYIATGLRISSSVALILAVTAELVIGSEGLGHSIGLAGDGGDVRLMYALILVTGVVGWTLNGLVARAERRVLHWHASMRPLAAAR
jgi:ABC-type nitrate/sulfonate/bicarbonate transport system permease component